MAHISADRVKETTTTTGTGAVTLAGAVTGFQAFSAVMANADTCWYCIAGGSEWEIGLGTWNTGGTLTRTTILQSSNADAAVNFSAGSKDVFITAPADKAMVQDNLGGETQIMDGQTPIAAARFFYNAVGSYNGYLQHAIQNKSSGTSASTDYIVTTNTGSDTAEYADFGINGSGFSGTWGAAKDAYLYVDGGASGVGNLIIGTQQANTAVDINVGGGASTNRVVRFTATGSLWTAFTSDPSTPAADTIHFYMKKIAGRIMPKWMGPSGVDTTAQPFQGMNHVRQWNTGTGTPTVTTVITAVGIAWTATGSTLSLSTPTTGSLKSRTRFAGLQSSATAGNTASVKGNQLEVGRESGFFLVMRWTMDTLIATQLCFFGLYASATAPGATINHLTSTAVAKVGMAVSSNTGNWSIVICSGSAVTATDLGANFPINNTDFLEMVLFCAPGASTISYRITNLTSGNTTSGDLTGANLPGATVYMTPLMWMSNNAAASAVKWSIKNMYLETDY